MTAPLFILLRDDADDGNPCRINVAHIVAYEPSRTRPGKAWVILANGGEMVTAETPEQIDDLIRVATHRCTGKLIAGPFPPRIETEA